MCSNPLFLVIYGIAWFHLYSLCQYGRVRKNLPVLVVCAVLFMGYLIYGAVSYHKYRKNSPVKQYLGIQACEDRFVLNGSAGEEFCLSMEEIRCVQVRKNRIFFFLKGWRYVQVDVSWTEVSQKDSSRQDLLKAEKENLDFVHLKLSSLPFFRKYFWRYFVCAALLLVTLAGAAGVCNSAIPYRGKLSWCLWELRDKRSVKLQEEHQNLFETGLEGVLADIRTKVDMPEKLCLSNSFNLHFLPDGTIDTLDTMLYGFDEKGNFTNSYLITYNRKHSNKMEIWLNDSAKGAYLPEKDFGVLRDALSAIDLEQAVSEWDEGVYGILYYGIRQWNLSDGGLLFVNESGETWEPYGMESPITGFSISVFCPDDSSIQPKRYLYRADGQMPLVQRPDGKEVTGNPSFCPAALDFEEIGSVETETKIYYLENQEPVYEYILNRFFLEASEPGAEKVNRTLSELYEKYRADYQMRGRSAETAASADELGMQAPFDHLYFEGIYYNGEDYCSLLMREINYFGGAHPYVTLHGYTFEKETGEIVDIENVTNMSEEEIIENINNAFIQAEGVSKVHDTYVGEMWLNDSKEAYPQCGFFLTNDGIVVYFGRNYLGNVTLGSPMYLLEQP